MALNAQCQVGGGHAKAIVGDTDEGLAAAAKGHINLAGTRIQRVLDKLLHNARRPLNDFARRDAVYGAFGKPVDSHECEFSPCLAVRALAA